MRRGALSWWIGSLIIAAIWWEVAHSGVTTRSFGASGSPSYGTPGVFSATNKPQAKQFPAAWRDTATPDLIWLHGGCAGVSTSNELWAYNQTSHLWAFISGTLDTIVNRTNVIQSQYGVPNTTASTNFREMHMAWAPATQPGVAYIYGGFSTLPGGVANTLDMWSWNSTNRAWTYWGNSPLSAVVAAGQLYGWSTQNSPGGRYTSSVWTGPDGTMWLFGGVAVAGFVNDLWSCKVVGGVPFQWRLMNPNSTTINVAPGGDNVYGTIRLSSGGYPTGRRTGALFGDPLDNSIIWLFGGYYDINNAHCGNDLWRFNVTTSAWIWFGGSNNASYSQGLLDTVTPTNTPQNWPSNRMFHASSQGTGAASSITYILGGRDETGTGLSDLWALSTKFINNPKWVWIGGVHASNPPPVADVTTFGTSNYVPATSAIPILADPRAPYVITVPTFRSSTYDPSSIIVELSLISVTANETPNAGLANQFLAPFIFQVTCLPSGYTKPINGEYAVALLLETAGTTGIGAISGNRATVVNGVATFNSLIFSADGLYTVRLHLVPLGTNSSYVLPFAQTYTVSVVAKPSISVRYTGVDTCCANGTYGTTFSASNVPPPRAFNGAWRDNVSPELIWTFAGSTNDNDQNSNELWLYNQTSHQWAFVGGLLDSVANRSRLGVQSQIGVANASAWPLPRAMVHSWSPSQQPGITYIYGGYAEWLYPPQFPALTDLWSFNRTSRVWTYWGDSGFSASVAPGQLYNWSQANKPGFRTTAGLWVDPDGLCWMFGGSSNGYQNDLWSFKVINGVPFYWRLMNPNTTTLNNPDNSGADHFGTLGIPSGGYPLFRRAASFWGDPFNPSIYWMFGGDSNAGVHNYANNELWRFNLTSSSWTWFGGGSNGSFSQGVVDVPASTNWPVGRGYFSYAMGTGPAQGIVYLVGGMDYQDHGLADMWALNTRNVSNPQWVWLGGDPVPSAPPATDNVYFGTAPYLNHISTAVGMMDSRFPGIMTVPSYRAVNYQARSTVIEYSMISIMAVQVPPTQVDAGLVSPTFIFQTFTLPEAWTTPVNGELSLTLVPEAMWGGNATVTGTTAVVQQGVATFSNLRVVITSGNNATITFRVYLSSPNAPYKFPYNQTFNVTVACAVGCYACTVGGANGLLWDSNCQVCDAAKGWLRDGVNGVCVNATTCPYKTYRYFSDCNACGTGCAVCSSWDTNRNACYQCDYVWGWRWDVANFTCIPACLPGQYDDGTNCHNQPNKMLYQAAPVTIFGTATMTANAVYGSIGVFDSSARIGPRAFSSAWRDTLYPELLWVFGAGDYSFTTFAGNELWAYNQTIRQWAFFGGLRDSISNDTLRAQASIIQSAYGVSNSSAWPPPRSCGMSWAPPQYPGIAYITGGFAVLGYNDQWAYNSSNRAWTFWGYGTLDTSVVVPNAWSKQNSPGARSWATTWVGPDGLMWLFGGTNGRNPNDLWSMSVTNGVPFNWRLHFPTVPPSLFPIPGETASDVDMGVYGTLGVQSGGFPSGRRTGLGFVDSTHADILWLFGGCILQDAPGLMSANDLWRFNITSAQWTWFGGRANGTWSNGRYDTAASTNWPMGRAYPMSIQGAGAASGITYFAGGLSDPTVILDVPDVWALSTKNINSPQFVWIGGEGVGAGEWYNTADVPTSDSTVFGQSSYMPAACCVDGIRDTQNPYRMTIPPFRKQTYTLTSVVMEISLLRIYAQQVFAYGGSDARDRFVPFSFQVVAVPSDFTTAVNDVSLVLTPLGLPSGTTFSGNEAPVVNGVATFSNFALLGGSVAASGGNFSVQVVVKGGNSIMNFNTTTGLVLTTCPTGYYATAAGCAPCAVGCLNCNGTGLLSSSCRVCNNSAGYKWDAGRSVCTTTCVTGSYSTYNACIACTFGCAACNGTGLNASVCQSCNPDYNYIWSVGHQYCQSGCSVGTFGLISTCYPCQVGCSNCNLYGLQVGYSCVTCDASINYYGDFSGICTNCTYERIRYVDGSGVCNLCPSISNCPPLNVRCTDANNVKCTGTGCYNNYFLQSGLGVNPDRCVGCDTCTLQTNQYVAAPCNATANTICKPCTTCNATSYISSACTLAHDTVCAACPPIAHCQTPACDAGPSNSRCTLCDEGFYVRGGVCVACDVCPRGTYQFDACTTTANTTCRPCASGCAACTGRALYTEDCQECDWSNGFLIDVAGQICVRQCGVHEWAFAGNATHAPQCMTCDYGCVTCTGAGLARVNATNTDPSAQGGCTACDESRTANYLIAVDGSACVADCAAAQYRNESEGAGTFHCSPCQTLPCASNQYISCTSSENAQCVACTDGCATCKGPGLTLSDLSCTTCNEAAGYAAGADGTCQPCAANCTLCSGSPTNCVGCAAGYVNPPGCAPFCSSPGCLTCVSPETCNSVCDAAFQGGACDQCSSNSRVGAAYPNCELARQTDPVSTGTTMGLLAALVAAVMIMALYKPLSIFYHGDQKIVTPNATMPLEIDFILSTRRLTLTVTTPVPVQSIFLEGVGILPESLALARTDPDSIKEPYTLTQTLTRKQCENFLSGNYRLNIVADAGLGVVTTSHKLYVPMRISTTNLLACFTILVEFIQLSSFCFGSGVTWWSADPVPSTLHYSLIKLPVIHDLWYIFFYTFVGLALFFVLVVILITTKIDRVCGRGKIYHSITGVLYGMILPFIGQTLYMPILSSMLSVMACSKPVTVAGASFSANFDPNRVQCWTGDHWIYVALAAIVILTFYPAAVFTLALWQVINAELDVRYFPTFLIVSGQVKFILTVTAELFSSIAYVQSILLIAFSLPVAILVSRRPPTVIYHLRWPIFASYAGVAWVGISSLVALVYPNNLISNAVLYAGWLVIFSASIFAATRAGHATSTRSSPAGVDAMARALDGDTKKENPSSASDQKAGGDSNKKGTRSKAELAVAYAPTEDTTSNQTDDALLADIDHELQNGSQPDAAGDTPLPHTLTVQ